VGKFPVILAMVSMVLVAGCGEDTTIIHQTTTTVSSPAAGDTTVVVQTEPSEDTPEVSAVPTDEAADAEPKEPPAPPKPEPSLDPSSTHYSGPCGDQGAVTGGEPGSSATTAQPGWTGLSAIGASCGDAVATANGWLAAWDPDCVAGCSLRIDDARCDYGGSGSVVECATADGRVRFGLVFEIG
jgi:hypothetical protein